MCPVIDTQDALIGTFSNHSQIIHFHFVKSDCSSLVMCKQTLFPDRLVKVCSLFHVRLEPVSLAIILFIIHHSTD